MITQRLLLSLLLLVGTPALAADTGLLLAGVSSGVSYQGPGDALSGATFYHGFQAYNAAYASSLGKSTNVRRASDNVACDIDFAATGALGLTVSTCNSSTQGGISYSAFVGTDATASCSTSGSSTSLVCTSASSTPNSHDPISGTGITQPAYIISCGTFTAGAGTCTMNVAQNIAVAETVTFQVAGFAPKQYDNTGNGNDISQATAGNQYQILPNCINSQPCLLSLAASNQTMSGAFTAPAQPITMVAVAQRYASFSQTDLLTTGVALFWVAANEIGIFAGNAVGITANDGSTYVFHGVVNSSSSAVYANGSGTTGLNAGTGVPATPIQLNDTSKPSSMYIGADAEWPSAMTGGQVTSTCHPFRIFWGTGGSC